MFIADVLGTVVSPVQHPVLDGRRLLLLRPLSPTGRRVGATRVALDAASAGPGDRVLVVDEGNCGRQLIGVPDAPVKTVVVGVIDYVEVDGALTYDAQRDDRAGPEGSG
jgi:microcompartment protein CcmK/EutM